MSREKQIDCKHYDQELDCCKMLSDWSEPMPVLQPCVEGACPKEKAMKQIEERCELIDLLDDIGRDWDNYLDECQESEAQPLFDYYEFHADAILEAGYRKQEWISVEDDSPKENGIYCVIVKNHKSRKCKRRTHARYKNGRWLDLYDDWENRCWDVTHWFPLPEAPKEGGAE